MMGFGYTETTSIYCIYLQVILYIFKSQNCRLPQQRFEISLDLNTVVSDMLTALNQCRLSLLTPFYRICDDLTLSIIITCLSYGPFISHMKFLQFSAIRHKCSPLALFSLTNQKENKS
jgi:hypothetical protein